MKQRVVILVFLGSIVGSGFGLRLTKPPKDFDDGLSLAKPPKHPKHSAEPVDAFDFDDGLQLDAGEDEYKSSQVYTETHSTGSSVAEAWNRCRGLLRNQNAHYTESAGSGRHNFLFVDNVKAGSTSIRKLLQSELGVSWTHTDMKGVKPSPGHRYESKDFITSDETEQLFKFSFVRDPVAKFESGVRQAWIEKAKRFEHMTKDEIKAFRKMTADEILDEVISKDHFVNEHLQPSSFRLATFDGRTPPSMIHFDFIGKLEKFDADWAAIVNSMQDISATKKEQLMSRLSNQNAHEHDPRSILTEAGIKKMCESSLFQFEWACFDYELPEVCKQ